VGGLTGLELRELLELLFHLSQHGARQVPKQSPQATIVNRSALIDHHFTVSSISRDAAWQLDSK